MDETTLRQGVNNNKRRAPSAPPPVPPPKKGAEPKSVRGRPVAKTPAAPAAAAANAVPPPPIKTSGRPTANRQGSASREPRTPARSTRERKSRRERSKMGSADTTKSDKTPDKEGTPKRQEKKGHVQDDRPKTRDDAQRRFAEGLALFTGVRMEYGQKVGTNLKVADETAVVFKQNLSLCRYKDVYCIDNMRVVLEETTPDTPGDFIHANYLNTDKQRLILTQGPTPATVNDFWRMVWQERVPVIVMLCELREQGKVKCAEYWPRTTGGTLQNAHVCVTNAGQNDVHPVPTETISITKLRLTREDKPEEGTRYVNHVQWANWPDKSVPVSSVAPLVLCQMMAQMHGRNVVIHCSAGIGRTGTLACIHWGIEKMDDAKTLDVRQLVCRMRQNRAHAVQTEMQYLFIIKSVLEHIRAVSPSVYAASASSLDKWVAEYLDLKDRAAGGEAPAPAAVQAQGCASPAQPQLVSKPSTGALL